MVTKESRKRMKKLNKEFSHADNSILLNEIIDKNIDTSDLMSSTNPYPNSSYQIQPYFDQLIQLCGYDIMLQKAVKNLVPTNIRRTIVKTSENWMKVVGIYIEIRDEEISDISFESVDNHLSYEENYEALMNNTTPPLDLFLLAKKEFEDAEINREVCIQRAKNNDNIPR